jgi:hypothetical protein
VITVIVFGRWIYLAHKNLPELGARYLHFTPGWAVGSLFVPLVNLWAPYQAMRDLAKASRQPVRWDLEDASPLIFIWWILWLIVNFVDGVVARSETGDHTREALETWTFVQIVSRVLSVPLYLLAFFIVRRVWRDQANNYFQMTNIAAAQGDSALPTP